MKTNIKKLYNAWSVLLVILVFIVVYLSILHPWLSRWGATGVEVSMPLPGDGVDAGTVRR